MTDTPQKIPRAKKILPWVGCAGVLIAVVLLYSSSLNNPLVFDSERALDIRFPPFSFTTFPFFGLRWVTHITFSLVNEFCTNKLVAQNSFNLAIHLLNTSLIFYLIRTALSRMAITETTTPALLGALLFGINPVCVYAVAYLMQRSILLTTLFSLLSLILFIRGLTANRFYFVLSILCYFLAVHAKEHAILFPLVNLLFGCLLCKKTDNSPPPPLKLRGGVILWVFLSYILIALDVVMRSKGIIGTAYEPHIRFVTEDIVAPLANTETSTGKNFIYPLSIMNQGALFFRYIFLFFVPYLKWMSIDIHLPFPNSFFSWPETAGIILFCFTPFLACFFFRREARWKIAGLVLLYPWLLFLTELSLARVTEPFVIYRSYLWVTGCSFVFAIFPSIFRFKISYIFLTLYFFILVYCTHERLATFKSLPDLWQDAVDKLTDDHLPGSYRPYNSLGYALLKEGKVKEGMTAINRSIEIMPDYPMSHFNLAWAQEKEGNHDEAFKHYKIAVQLQPNYTDARINLGALFLAHGNFDEAYTHLKIAEALNPNSVKVLNNLGGLYNNLKMWEKAIVYYDKAIAHEPCFATAHYNKGIAKSHLNRVKEARENFIRALECDPGLSNARRAIEEIKRLNR